MNDTKESASAIISRLARIERPRKSLPDFSRRPTWLGTQSMEVPFAALRVECYWCRGSNKVTSGKTTAEGEIIWMPDPECEGHGWVPELDIEKACWRIWERLAVLTWDKDWHLMLAQATDMKEAVLRAAEQYMAES